MARKALTYSAVLIGTYLVLNKYTGAAKLLSAAGSAGNGFARTLQGR